MNGLEGIRAFIWCKGVRPSGSGAHVDGRPQSHCVWANALLASVWRCSTRPTNDKCKGSEDHVNTRILQTMVSEIYLILLWALQPECRILMLIQGMVKTQYVKPSSPRRRTLCDSLLRSVDPLSYALLGPKLEEADPEMSGSQAHFPTKVNCLAPEPGGRFAAQLAVFYMNQAESSFACRAPMNSVIHISYVYINIHT